jgi:tRNA pseudouridine13 synthase
MCVYAFQSHLWNDAARRIMRQIGGAERAFEVEDPFGPMVFVDAPAVPQSWRELVMPVLGKGSELREPWGGAAKASLASVGLSAPSELRIRAFRRPYFGEAERPLFVRASGFVAGAPVRDELIPKGKRLRRELRFTLPRGSYATVLLRALGH